MSGELILVAQIAAYQTSLGCGGILERLGILVELMVRLHFESNSEMAMGRRDEALHLKVRKRSQGAKTESVNLPLQSDQLWECLWLRTRTEPLPS